MQAIKQNNNLQQPNQMPHIITQGTPIQLLENNDWESWSEEIEQSELNKLKD